MQEDRLLSSQRCAYQSEETCYDRRSNWAGGAASTRQSANILIYSHDLRKSIAKVLTVINANQRAQLRLFYKGKKYLPLDLRPKQTRAIRRRLSKHESGKKLEKVTKRSTHFPQRKFAIKVRIMIHSTYLNLERKNSARCFVEHETNLI